MELGVAKWLTAITPEPSMFIIDCVHNMDGPTINASAVPLVQFLRKDHPTTPIVLVEGTPFGRDWQSAAAAAATASANGALAAAYADLVAGGVTHLLYVKSSDLFSAAGGDLLDTPTNTGLHPTDAGMRDVSDFWIRYLPTVLP